MSEPIPESIPTSADPRSRRPLKKRALSPSSKQSANIDALFANPDKPNLIPLPPKAKTLAAPPEIVAYVQGSSAGAGSGEFHVYKQSRRREGERLRMMDEEKDKEEKDREWEEQRKAKEDELKKKTGKNAARRQKQKANREKAKKGIQDDEVNGDGGAQPKGIIPKRALGEARDDATGEQAEGGEAPVGITIHDDD